MVQQHQTNISKVNRVFVNRSLNFSNIRLVGFDMDHTLGMYNQETFESLAFHETLKKFINAGYPEELSHLKFKPDFLIRGLLVDREKGNLLKVDCHKYVKDAYHGYNRLSKEMRHSLYNKQCFKADQFLSVDTFFSLSEVQLFVEIVDYMDKNPGRIAKTFSEVYKDLRYFIDLSHQDGSIKNKVLKNPEKYLIRDRHLATTLVRLLDSGKQLFLLTNSQFDYTDVIMETLFDGAHEDFSNWKDYWDYIITGANKPMFFMGGQPFFEVVEDSGLLKIHSGPLEKGKLYHGGNAASFEKLTGHIGDEILYVGDHIYGDIIRSKGSLNWRTLLVVQELEDEIPKFEAARESLFEIEETIKEKEAQDEVIQKLRSKLAAAKRQHQKCSSLKMDKKLAQIEQDIIEYQHKIEENNKILQTFEEQIRTKIERRDAQIHPVWGELMKVGMERSRFANQVDLYACLYTSKVSNLRFYSPLKRFIASNAQLPHELD